MSIGEGAKLIWKIELMTIKIDRFGFDANRVEYRFKLCITDGIEF